MFSKQSAINLAISQILKIKTNKIYIVIICAVLVLPMIYGQFKVNKYDFKEEMVDIESNNFINIAMIQPNINPWKKWENTSMEQIEILNSIMDSLLKNNTIDLVLFPETAIPSINLQVNRDLELPFFDDLLIQNNAALLTGISRIHIYTEYEIPSVTAKKIGNETIAHYNSAILYDNKNPTQIYDKMRLTPLAERFPFIEYLPFMKELLQWGVGISSWTIGEKLEPMIFKKGDDSVKIGTIICIESIHPSHIRDLVNKGTNILVVITNDSWYDGSYGPYQHNIMSIARAIEHRQYIARCTNSGISCFISPTGKIILQAPQYQKTGISKSVPLVYKSEITIYTYLGDVLPLLCFVVVVVYVVLIKLKIY